MSPTYPRVLTRTVIAMPTPVVVGGKPTMPGLRAKIPLAKSTIKKITHGPAPKRAPKPGRTTTDHPAKIRAGRWTVDDLPDPSGYGGWYWLGTPSGADGTAGIAKAARQWSATDDSRVSAAWHSRFPFKPSVSARDSYLFGGGVVHHPKGVNFNSFYVEHMWLEFGLNRPQPFTWVIACLVANWPSPVQHVLDAGKAPPRSYSASEMAWPHRLGGEANLGYRTKLELREHRVDIAASGSAGKTLRLKHGVPSTPRMYLGVFDGAHSRVGVFGPEGKKTRKGDLAIGATHRHVVLGRQQGWLDRNKASHLLVFEIRYWTDALSLDQLHDEYRDIASRWNFGAYSRGG